MKKEIIITYEWWNNDIETIKLSHQEALEEDAKERIFEMIDKGYTSGDLHSQIRIDEEDGSDGIEYDGSWSLTTKTL